MENKRNIKAIIVAAGKGSRFGGDVPKQFCDLCGRPVLMTTVERMADAVGRENIILVLDASMEQFWLELCRRHHFVSPQVVHGGSTRWESVRNAVVLLPSSDAMTVMVHDGARPLASVRFLSEISSLPEDADAVIPVVKVTDSLRELEGNSSHAVDRSRFVAVQTPQVFPLKVLRDAYSMDYSPTMTDDASVIEAAGYKNIFLAEGEPTNIKITNPLDLAIAEAVLVRQL